MVILTDEITKLCPQIQSGSNLSGLSRDRVDSKFWRKFGYPEHPSDVVLRILSSCGFKTNLSFNHYIGCWWCCSNRFVWSMTDSATFCPAFRARTKQNMSDDDFSSNILLYLPHAAVRDAEFVRKVPEGLKPSFHCYHWQTFCVSNASFSRCLLWVVYLKSCFWFPLLSPAQFLWKRKLWIPKLQRRGWSTPSWWVSQLHFNILLLLPAFCLFF